MITIKVEKTMEQEMIEGFELERQSMVKLLSSRDPIQSERARKRIPVIDSSVSSLKRQMTVPFINTQLAGGYDPADIERYHNGH